MPDSAIAIAAAQPDSPDAIRLMEALDDELRTRYPAWEAHGLRGDEASDARFIFLIACMDGLAIGCGAVRGLQPGIGEIKRMFVRKELRGTGVARQLLAALELKARDLGYSTLRIESGNRQPEAIGLYQSAGYMQIEPFGDYVGNPVSVCFEKQLA